MLNFSGVMNRSQFTVAAVIRLGLFIGCISGLPLLLKPMLEVYGCHGPVGTCGAFVNVIYQLFRFLITWSPLIFVYSFIGICLRRTRDTGLPASLGLIVPLLFLAAYFFLDNMLLTYVGIRWSLAFTHGDLNTRLPWFSDIAIAMIVLLCVWPRRAMDGNDTAVQPNGNEEQRPKPS